MKELKAELEGTQGLSKIKAVELKYLYVETKLQEDKNKYRLEKAIEQGKVKERLKLLTSFQILKKSFRLTNSKPTVYNK